jgi:ABC-type multidrug transport system ATPase subunit
MEIVGLSKHFGDQAALRDVSFAIRRGEIVGLIGPNGSGKTTLLECLAGLLPADAGKVKWFGAPLPPRRRKTALFYVPDGITPYAEHSVASVLAFLSATYRLPSTETAEAVKALALAPVLPKRVGALSKGYRRRLLLALGLLTPPPLLIIDEPFDGLDLHQTREVMVLLRRAAARGRTLLLSIHQLSDAERICNRFVLLAAGRVCGEGALDTLRAACGRPAGTLEEVFLALT